MRFTNFQSNHYLMIYKFKSVVFIILAVLLSTLHSNLYAQNPRIISPQDTLLVGIAGSEPFVFSDAANAEGIAIEIWENIAKQKKWNFKYRTYATVEEALHSLENDKLDLVVGPISITANRVEYLRFSQPFYNSSLAILSRADALSFWQRIKPLFSLKLIVAVFIFLVILAIVGTLLWFAERKASPEQFPQDPVKGVGTGMWLAIVTMSTTGYGDKAPITLAGRIIAGSWMIISIIFATSMVAGIASTLTLTSMGSSTVSNIEELSGRKTATIIGSPAESYLKTYKAKISSVNTLDDAISQLREKEVDAVVYDRPQLLYYLKNHRNDDLFIAKAEYYKQGYGFAFPLNSNMVYDVNRALLTLAESQKTTKIIDFYLDKDE